MFKLTLESLWARRRRSLGTGLAVFIGVAFLVRYVAEHTYLPIELRLSGVAAVGVVLLGLGWRLRTKRPAYALALQGGAIGILYLTVFASLRLFHVMPPEAAFAVLVVLSALCAALAVLQDSMAFALLAIGCGFLAPVLASSGQGNHVVLFSYYAVLNLGIFAIAWAAVLLMTGMWAARENRRWVVNLVAVFGAIHFYTQYFERLGASPGTIVLAGLAAIGLALALVRYNRSEGDLPPSRMALA